MQKSNKIINEYIWAEYHPVTVIVNNPVDITNPQQLQRFWDLVDEFESLERCKGNISTLLWLREYEIYFKKGDMVDELFGMLGFSGGNDTFISSSTGIDFSKLESFLQSPFSQHWNAFLKIGHKDSKVYVTSFWFTVAYQNTSTWDARIELMREWREIASRYADMNVTVWEENAMFVDQMSSLKNVAITTGLLTLACMAIVCAVFIPNLCSVITATLAIASISIGVVGFYFLWGLDLDPVTMAAILMSIGLSVDFIAHVAYHYQLTYKKVFKNGKITKIPIKNTHEKLVNTFENIAWPMCQAALSTIVCILPLLFFRSYPPVVFVKTIFLVVGWGTLHGLVFLPGLLAALPECLTSARCCPRRCSCSK
uniref:SSD domain-containing protein n=1 Tax=Panagrolaimus sp. ES5 TaxID=591445 RepID=A0AC34FR65_9BILA